MEIESAAFINGETIPQKHTCEGEDLSPPLHFVDLPLETKSLVIIMDDPDAPVGVFTHWLAWNIPPTDSLAEGASIRTSGKNDFGVNGYRGPCPPLGQTHRYFFKVYALNAILDLPAGSNKATLEKTLKPHILGSAELVGRYKKIKN